MPPKTKNANQIKKTQSRGGRNGKADADQAMLDALVQAIESAAPKKGMTGKQAQQHEAKAVEAIDRLQGRGARITPEQIRDIMLTRQMMQQRAIEEAQYVNVPVDLTAEHMVWQEVAPNKYIRYEQFTGKEDDMNFIVKLFTDELSEPYSSFTYQYFVYGWPDLCLTAYGLESTTKPDSSVTGEKVGCIVSRVARKGPGKSLRGYVAMFAVVPRFRGFRLGSRLIALTAELMKKKGCDEVYLETPTSNDRALSLYLNLGFVKTKFLPCYYLDRSDAVRLKMWLKDALPYDQIKAATAAVEAPKEEAVAQKADE